MKDIRVKQFASLIEDIQYEVSLLSNASACLNMMLEDVSWVGFYIYQDEKLILGPFQGKTACTQIKMGVGVCGSSAQTQETLLVEDVHTFPTHIACDAASNSEIVVPIVIDGSIYGVLDLDSTSFARFTKEDQIFLEACVDVLVQALKKIKSSN